MEDWPEVSTVFPPHPAISQLGVGVGGVGGQGTADTSNYQASAVQKLDSTIHRINLYPVNKY